MIVPLQLAIRIIAVVAIAADQSTAESIRCGETLIFVVIVVVVLSTLLIDLGSGSIANHTIDTDPDYCRIILVKLLSSIADDDVNGNADD